MTNKGARLIFRHRQLVFKEEKLAGIPYEFESIDKLIEDFYADLERILEEL